MKDGKPEVKVHLKRHIGNQVLVMIKGDPLDEEPIYFDKLTKDEPVGFVLNTLGDPHRIGIDDGGLYGGEFVLLNDWEGGFGACPPQALIDLLLPNGAVEATYPCIAESDEFDLYFTLPEGGLPPVPVLQGSAAIQGLQGTRRGLYRRLVGLGLIRPAVPLARPTNGRAGGLVTPGAPEEPGADSSQSGSRVRCTSRLAWPRPIRSGPPTPGAPPSDRPSTESTDASD